MDKIKYLDKYSGDNYRYRLKVKFKEKTSSDKTIVVLQLNPSYASLDRSDPTAGKVENWAINNGYEKILFFNLFAYIDPDFSNIVNKPYEILVGKHNNELIKKAFQKYDTIVAAWGATCYREHKEIFIKRLIEIKKLLNSKMIYKVGELCYNLHPRHGLVWNNNPVLTKFDFDEYLKLIC